MKKSNKKNITTCFLHLRGHIKTYIQLILINQYDNKLSKTLFESEKL